MKTSILFALTLFTFAATAQAGNLYVQGGQCNDGDKQVSPKKCLDAGLSASEIQVSVCCETKDGARFKEIDIQSEEIN